MSALQLMKKDKLELATYIKSECQGSRGTAHLNILLDFLLDPTKTLDDAERLDWCRYLIAGGLKFDVFAKTVSSYDNAAICGLVWSTDFVAYRCRTCGLTPCMSLCADCFQAGDHEGHDFNMFRSHAGGACDCGDVGVMKPEGYCSRHGPENIKKARAPEELMCVARYMVPRLIERLLQQLQEHYQYSTTQTYSVSLPDLELYLDFLHQLSDMGAAMREIIAGVLIDENLYSRIVHDMKTKTQLQMEQSHYERALSTLQAITVPDEFSDIAELRVPLIHCSILEEMLFWVLKYEYPQKLVTLLLSMLPIDNYKESFATGFLKHYQYLSVALCRVAERSRMANSVVHISVQLFSPLNIASRLVNDHYLLHIVLSSLYHMLSSAITHDFNNEHSTHQYIDCLKPVMKDHCYWPLTSDLVNLLTQENIAHYFMSDSRLLSFWLRIVSSCQEMNLNIRELWRHVEYEPESYFASYGAEHEICASTLWTLVTHLEDETTLNLSRKVLQAIIRALCNWLNASRIPMFAQLKALQVSFHYPLHRFLAVFLSNAVSRQGLSVEEVFPVRQQEAFIHTLAAHPFQTFVALAEIDCGLWVRNGQQMRGQALTYSQCHFCNGTIDADLFLLQVLASRMEPDTFIMKVLMRFHVLDLLSVAPAEFSMPRNPNQTPFLSKEQEMPMLEQALLFLCTLLSARTFSGTVDQELVRKEMVALLCVADRTHSQLVDCIPDKSSQLNRAADKDNILKQVSTFTAPVFSAVGALQQGKYKPTDDVWLNEFDPIHTLLRVTYKRDYVSAMDRYSDHVKRKKLHKGSSNPWPPCRIPAPLHPEYARLVQLLHCRSMHGLIFSLLHKAVKDPSLPEPILYYTLHLLELCVSLPNVEDPLGSSPFRGVPWRDNLFFTWYESSSIADNVRLTVDKVLNWSAEDCDMAMEVYSDLDLMEDLPHLPHSTPSLPASAGGSEPQTTHHSLSTLPFSFLSSFARRINKKEAPQSSAPQRLAVSGQVTQYTIWTPPSSTAEAGREADSVVTARHVDTAHSNQQSSTQALTGHIGRASKPQGSAGISKENKNGRKTVVNESMVTLLVKLHKRFSETFGSQHYTLPQSTRPTTRQEVVIAKFSASGETLETASGGLPPDSDTETRETSKYARIAIDDRVACGGLVSGGAIAGDGAGGIGGGASGFSGDASGIGSGASSSSSSDGLGSGSGSGIDSGTGNIGSGCTSGKGSGSGGNGFGSKMGNAGGRGKQAGAERDHGVTSVDSRVGDGAFFISKILDKICDLGGECEAHVREVVKRIYPPPAAACSSSSQTGETGGGSPGLTSDELRKKAKKRQEKLLKEFAARQKQFMEKVNVSDVSGANDEEGNISTQSDTAGAAAAAAAGAGGSSALVNETLYDCCICNMSTPSTFDQPVGLVCIFKSTSVLAHRRHVKERISLPLTEDGQFHMNAASESYIEFLNRIRLLQDLFNEESCLMSVNMGWQGSVYASTCRHHLHLDCHQAYLDSLRTQARTQLNQTLRVDKGEFWCPVCRQLSNCLLPLIPDVNQLSTDVVPLSRLSLVEERRIIERLSDIFASYSAGPINEAMKKSMQAVIEALSDAMYPQYRTIHDFSDSPSLTYCYRSSILRMNIELELIHHKSGSPCQPLISSCAPKKSCIGPLFNVLSNYCKKVQMRPHTTVWMQVTGISPELTSQQSLSVCKYNQDVPLLLRDLTTLFLQLILSLPPSPDKSLYQSIVRAVYNVQLVQAFVSISCKFSTDELSAWRGKGLGSSYSTLQSVMSQVLSHLEHSSIYEHDSMDTDLPAICQSVWSPLSVEAEAVEHLTPYLRVAAQLQSRIYNDTIPLLTRENKHEEFGRLVGYLGLCHPGRGFSTGGRSGSSAVGGGSYSCTDCLNWACDDPSALVRAWCLGLAAVDGRRCSSSDTTRLLLCQNPTWHNPRLVSLPRYYNDLFQFYRKRTCSALDSSSKSRRCKHSTPPKYPAICLACGQLLCYKDQCCTISGVGEAVQHAIDCGGGTAMLLLIKSCVVSIVRGPRYTIWGSIYLDEHGEEDRELKRGKPLMLNEERYNMLRMMWLTHNFDQTCKLWSPHINQL